MFTFGTEENDEENKNYLQFNYKKYYSLLNGLIKFYFEIESSVTETDQSKLKESVVRAYKVIKDKPNSNKLALLKVKEILNSSQKTTIYLLKYTIHKLIQNSKRVQSSNKIHVFILVILMKLQ